MFDGAIIDCYPYSRVSTTRQLSGMGMELQNDNLQKALAEHPNWRVKASFFDLGISAFDSSNVLEGELGEFIKLVKGGKVKRGSVLIVYSLDRVSRDNIIDAQGLLLDLLRAGVVICTTIDKMVFSRYDDQRTVLMNLMSSLMIMVRANEESETKRQRANAVLAKKRSDPNLKILTQSRPAWVDIENGEYVANEGAKTVKRIFDEAASGMGSFVIAAGLNRDNIPTLTGKLTYPKFLKDGRTPNPHPKAGQSKANMWAAPRVVEILRSDAPMGWLQLYRSAPRDEHADRPPGKLHKGKVPDGPPRLVYPVVVKQTVADKARYWLDKRAFGGDGKGRKGSLVSNLFSGVAKCRCGSSMFLANKHPKRGLGGWLRCAASVKDITVCSNRTGIPYGRLEDAVIRDLKIISRIVESSANDSAVADIAEPLAEKQAEAAKLQARIDAMNEDEDTPYAVLQPLLKRNGERRLALLAEIEALQRQLNSQTQAKRNVDELASDFAERLRWDDLKVVRQMRAELAGVIRTVVKTLTCYPDKKVVLMRLEQNELMMRIDGTDTPFRNELAFDEDYELHVWGGAEGYMYRLITIAELSKIKPIRGKDGSISVSFDATHPDWLEFRRRYQNMPRGWNMVFR